MQPQEISVPTPVTISIVSHGQARLIRHLLGDLARIQPKNTDLLITINIPEDESDYLDLPFPVKFIRNLSPQGFGANHNAAFSHSTSPVFAVVNPDIRLPTLSLSTLLAPFDDTSTAVVAPVVVNSRGELEDNVRRFPTFLGLVRRVFTKRRTPDYTFGKTPITVDWAAGMFLLFRSDAFAALGGFDSRRFYMYYEDIDICRRIHRKGWKVILHPGHTVIHDAQRASRRSIRHFYWHATSILRYLSGL